MIKYEHYLWIIPIFLICVVIANKIENYNLTEYELLSYMVAATLLFLAIFPYRFNIGRERREENKNRIDKFYTKIEKFSQNIVENGFNPKYNYMDELEEIGQYKYLAKPKTKNEFMKYNEKYRASFKKQQLQGIDEEEFKKDFKNLFEKIQDDIEDCEIKIGKEIEKL